MQTDQQDHNVCVVGALDFQYQNDELVTSRRNYVSGRGFEEQLMLQIVSPFGSRFSLKLLLDHSTQGIGLLADTFAGIPLVANGNLEWQRQPIPGLPKGIQLTRSSMSCSLRVSQLAFANGDEDFGCDVSMQGTIVASPRVTSHPLRPSMLLASTLLEIQHNRQRKASRAQFKDVQRVPIVINAHHPDAPNLLRIGNCVHIEGMLERVPVEMKGEDIDKALEDLELAWMLEQQQLKHPEDREKAERRYLSRHHRIQHSSITRIMVGFVELLDGSAQSLRSAQAARRKQHRSGVTGQKAVGLK